MRQPQHTNTEQEAPYQEPIAPHHSPQFEGLRQALYSTPTEFLPITQAGQSNELQTDPTSNSLCIISREQLQELNIYEPPTMLAIFNNVDNGGVFPLVKHKQVNEDGIKEALTLLYLGLFEEFDADPAKAVRKIEGLVKITLSEYYYLTPEDITLFCYRAINQDFGECYGTLTTPKVLGWLKKYTKERQEKAIEQSTDKANQHKERGGTNVSSDKASEELNRMLRPILEKGRQ